MTRGTIARVLVVVAFSIGVYTVLEKSFKILRHAGWYAVAGIAIACFLLGNNPGVRQMLCGSGHRSVSFRSWVLAKGIRPNVSQLAPEVIRSQFTKLPFVPVPVVSDAHSHPELAADRTSGSNFMNLLAAALGLERYSFQRSAPDVRHSIPGNRYFYWARDVAVPYSDDLPTNNSLVTLVDTDYYVPMKKFLTSSPFSNRPVVLYTVGLRAVASTDVLSGMYTFDAQKQMHTYLSGGAEFVHRVWNWDTDALVVTRRVLGLPWRVAIYNVDRRACSGPKQLVLLTPIAQFHFPWSCFAAHLPGRQLEYVNPVAGEFLRLAVVAKDGYKVSTGRVGSFLAATISGDVDESLAIAARLGKTTLSIPTVMSYFPENKMDRERAALLCDYHRAHAGDLPGVVYPVECAARAYQFSPPSFDPDAPPLMTAFMSPFVNAGFVPADTTANVKQAILGRVTNITMSGLTFDGRMISMMKEFIDLVAPVVGCLSPGEYEDTLERQKRPAQRRVLEVAETMGEFAELTQELMLKRESYGVVKDPRVIRIIPPAVKAGYAAYIYPVAEYMKRFPWYASCMTPAEMAGRVADLLRNAKSAVEGDANRWDGRLSPALRLLERLLMMRLYRPEFRSRLSELMESQFNQHCAVRGGKGFDSGTDRSSGSMETSVLNGVDNAFISYVARRACRVMNHFRTPQEAFENLGLFAGDDSLTIDVDPGILMRSAARYGQQLAVVPRKRNEPGVMFLARCYGPNVWHGDPSSMCDLARQLAKFHLTVRMQGVSPTEKLVAKCLSFVQSDHETPVLGPYCKAVLSCAERQDYDLSYGNAVNQQLKAYHVAEDPLNNYPNDNEEDWMNAFIAAKWPRLQFDRFLAWLEETRICIENSVDGVDDISLYLSPPLCAEMAEPAPRADVVVMGEDGADEVVKGKPKKLLPPVKATRAQKEQFRAQRQASTRVATASQHVGREIRELAHGSNKTAAHNERKKGAARSGARTGKPVRPTPRR